MSQNIFHKVIKSENQISQLLVNLVNDNADIRKVIVQFLFPKKKFPDDEFIVKSFDNQKRNENGQPDIRFDFYNSSSKRIGHVIIEVKTKDSRPTDNQPEGYVTELLREEYKEIQKFLFFLIPRYYNYKAEINARYNALKGIDLITKAEKYWDELAKELLKLKTFDESDSFEKKLLLNVIIEHLQEIFLFKEVNFTTSQIEIMTDSYVPGIILQLNDIIFQVEKNYNFKNMRNEIAESADYFGRWYKDGYKDLIWFGYDYKIWKEHKTPLILSVNKTVNYAAFEKFDSVFSECFEIKTDKEDGKFISIPIDENPVEKICGLIDQFSKALLE